MIVFLRLLLCVVSLCFAEVASAAPTLTGDATMAQIKAAIAAGSARDLARIDDRIEYIPVWDGTTITPEAAMDLLRGCQFQAMSVNRLKMASLAYACPQRTAHLPCTIGGLRVLVYDDNGKTEIGITEERRFDGGCPMPPVPRMPAAFEPDIALKVAQALVEGHEGAVANLLTEKVQVGRMAKYATGSPEIEFSGSGYAAFSEQARFLVAKLGRPTAASCDSANSICKFALNGGGKFLFAAIMTRNHQVEFIQFFYSTREMVLERLRQRH